MGYSFTCARLASGDVQCWGSNRFGQLGDGTLTSRTTAAVSPALSGFVHIATGALSGHACGVRRDGTVRCWGANSRCNLVDDDCNGVVDDVLGAACP